MRWVRVGAAVTAVLAVLAVTALVLAGGMPDVRAVVQDAGWWAPLLFVLLQGALTVLPVPRTVFTVAAGVLFGSVTGVLLAVVATTLAAVAAFFLVRLVGASLVERYTGHRAMAWVRARLDRSGLLAVLSLRLFPMMPFWALNYASSLSGVRFPPYLLGTVLGVLPGTVMVVVLGDAAVSGSPHPAALLVSVVCGVIGVTGALVAGRRPAGPAAGPAESAG